MVFVICDAKKKKKKSRVISANTGWRTKKWAGRLLATTRTRSGAKTLSDPQRVQDPRKLGKHFWVGR